ncbi:hypothetical protein BDR06DRAFT_960781 [Suillus hirtellus]|nr:hypothetical protein BDR06DRAFT_960781 [Suillus hirtellus]
MDAKLALARMRCPTPLRLSAPSTYAPSPSFLACTTAADLEHSGLRQATLLSLESNLKSCWFMVSSENSITYWLLPC